MSQLKADVIQYLTTDRTFDGARQLYLQYGPRGSFYNRASRALESLLMRDMLRDELVKLAGIPEQVAAQLFAQRIVMQADPVIAEASPAPTTTNPPATDQAEAAAEAERKKFITQLKMAIGRQKSKIEKKGETEPEKVQFWIDELAKMEADLAAYTEEKPAKAPAAETPAESTGDEAEKPVTISKVLAELPEEVRKSIRLREEFPFLATADCPPLLKQLVGHMLDAYDKYRHAHQALFAATTDEDIAELSKTVVDNYIENREIWDELNHFKNHGKILGKHVIFKSTLVEEKVAAMSVVELAKRKETLVKSISRKKNQLEKESAAKPHLVEGWKNAMAADEAELQLVVKALESADKK